MNMLKLCFFLKKKNRCKMGKNTKKGFLCRKKIIYLLGAEITSNRQNFVFFFFEKKNNRSNGILKTFPSKRK